LLAQLVNHLADRAIHEFDLAEHRLRRRAGRVHVATKDAVLNQLLAHAHRLEIHSKYRGYWSAFVTKVRFPFDPVQHCVYLELIVALDVLEAVGPSAPVRVRSGAAIESRSGADARQVNDVGTDVGRIVVIYVARYGSPGRPRHSSVDGVLVCPGRAAARGVDDSVDCVGPDEVPGIHGSACVWSREGIAWKSGWVDGQEASINRAVRPAGPNAVQILLIEIHAFFVLRAGPIRCSRSAVSCGESIAGVL